MPSATPGAPQETAVLLQRAPLFTALTARGPRLILTDLKHELNHF